MIPITDQEFLQFQRFIFEAAGITLSPAKKALVSGRLAKRLQHWNASSYAEYFRLLVSGRDAGEVQMAIDLLTTNETYFFRESRHFDLLQDYVAAAGRPRQPLRVWSAACSTGEEVYSIAMVLADALGGAAWEVLGSDISARVLARARTGHYPLERTRQIPAAYLREYCLKGTGGQSGTLLIDRRLRAHTRFMQVNLNASLPQLGSFDAIFLRNVMIYFNGNTKQQVVARVLSLLKPGGLFFIGHSESLHGIVSSVEPVVPSVYRKI